MLNEKTLEMLSKVEGLLDNRLMNNDDDNLGRSVDLHRERSSHVVSPTESVKDRTIV
jgi:hypothetical protein